MNDFTKRFIYTIKARFDDPYTTAVKFMAKECNYPEENYSITNMYRIVKEKFTDYISSCDYPHVTIDYFLEYVQKSYDCYFNNPNDKKRFSSNNIMKHTIDAMLFALQDTQVKEKDMSTGEYYYINGFSD